MYDSWEIRNNTRQWIFFAKQAKLLSTGQSSVHVASFESKKRLEMFLIMGKLAGNCTVDV